MTHFFYITEVNMSGVDFFLLLFLISFIFYWLDSLRAKEIATKNALSACEKILLGFLDGTVVIQKVRLRRNVQGQIAIYREYGFEFTSTGERRYKGWIRLLGKHLIDVEMEPYKFHELDE